MAPGLARMENQTSPSGETGFLRDASIPGSACSAMAYLRRMRGFSTP